MWIDNLIIKHARCIEHAQLTLSPGLNIFIGDNGAGKTSLLEAISVLSQGRSFRTHKISNFIQKGIEAPLLVSVSCHSDKQSHTQHLGIEKKKVKHGYESIGKRFFHKQN